MTPFTTEHCVGCVMESLSLYYRCCSNLLARQCEKEKIKKRLFTHNPLQSGSRCERFFFVWQWILEQQACSLEWYNSLSFRLQEKKKTIIMALTAKWTRTIFLLNMADDLKLWGDFLRAAMIRLVLLVIVGCCCFAFVPQTWLHVKHALMSHSRSYKCWNLISHS